jgi:acyl-CoA thioesterase II
MTATIESAWPKYPDYRIDLVPVEPTARVWFGDLLLAESSGCLRLEETRHVDRLYFPESDVNWDLFTFADGVHTICPFKGQADYWNLTAPGVPEEEAIVWFYPDPFQEVAGIRGYVCFYHERTRVEVDEPWANDAGRSTRTRKFPAWGDAAELIRVMDVQPTEAGKFIAPAYGDTARDVVEGGQFMGDAIVAASKLVPDQRVVSAYLTFAKSASFSEPLDVTAEVLHGGRSFSTVEVRFAQDAVFRSGGLLLLGSEAQPPIHHSAPMPEVGDPEDAVFLDMGVSGRELRVIDAAYDPDPSRIGPPEIYAWCRFRDDPGPQYLQAALLAQSTTHWTIGAAMRPHPGFGEAAAHSTLSTGVMSCAIAFHDEFDVTQWLLYANPAIYAGRGLAHGEGRVYTQDGRLVASYSCEVMIRPFTKTPATMGMDWKTVM